MSPSTRVNDYILKRALYAEAGVQFYLIIDPVRRPVRASLLGLRSGEYVEIATSESGVQRFERPFSATITLPA